MQDSYDVVVVGGGAGGLNAALVLARSRRAVAVVDDGRPRNAPAGHVRGYLTRDGTAPSEVLDLGWKELSDYGVTRIDGRASRLDDARTVELADGRALTTRRVVVATGLRDELPDLPGVAERWGRDVLHCPYCHGYEVRDRPLAVLGTHSGAVHHAQLVRQWSSDLLYFAHTRPTTDDERRALTARGIDIVEGEIENLVVTDDRLQGVAVAGSGLVERSAAFLFPTMVPHDDLLTGLGCERDPATGMVATDRTGRTSAPGVWAVGNVVDPRAQVVTAAGMGSAAAFAVNVDLVQEEVARALADAG